MSSGQGKVREIPDLAKVREKSGNFVEGQGKMNIGKIQGKVREFAFSAILVVKNNQKSQNSLSLQSIQF